MRTYTSDELLLLQSSHAPSRSVRKTIFSLHLWLPRYERRQLARPQKQSQQQQSDTRLSAAAPVFTPRELTATNAECRNSVPSTVAPSLYVFNAAGLEKLNAVDHFASDLASYNVDVAVISETHFKTCHTDSVVGVPGYNLFRRDRKGRRGGGVALYVRSTLQASTWTYSADDRTYELRWVRVCNNFIAALRSSSALASRRSSTSRLAAPTSSTVSTSQTRSCTAVSTVHVVTSVVQSDHKAVVAFSDKNQCAQSKTTFQRTFSYV